MLEPCLGLFLEIVLGAESFANRWLAQTTQTEKVLDLSGSGCQTRKVV